MKGEEIRWNDLAYVSRIRNSFCEDMLLHLILRRLNLCAQKMSKFVLQQTQVVFKFGCKIFEVEKEDKIRS